MTVYIHYGDVEAALILTSESQLCRLRQYLVDISHFAEGTDEDVALRGVGFGVKLNSHLLRLLLPLIIEFLVPFAGVKKLLHQEMVEFGHYAVVFLGPIITSISIMVDGHDLVPDDIVYHVAVLG